MRRRSGTLALVALALGAAWLQQGPDFNQNAHYALVRAMTTGTPQLDQTLGEVGDLSTRDTIEFEGHVYSDKAPGLALVTLPAFIVLDASGLIGEGDPTPALWSLGLVGCVVPFLLLLVLVRQVAELFTPGFGTIAAVAVGAGTILLPYATLFYSHLLSAFLVFAAYAVLVLRRDADPFRGSLLAGVLAGYAGTTEYPNVIAGALLGLYAIATAPRLRRAAGYAIGGALGLLPLALYNVWAFGSPTHLSRRGLTGSGPSEDVGFFGVEIPSVHRTVELLFSTTGLLTLAPVLAVALGALPALYRHGRRADALLAGAIVLGYIAFNSGYSATFGGFAPGPRYVSPILPFLALPLGIAFRHGPVVTGALAAVSVVIMTTITATHALAAYNLAWFDRVSTPQFTQTAAALVDVTGWYTILLFFVAVAAAAAFAVLATSMPILRRWEPVGACAGVLGWALVALAAPVQEGLGGRGMEFDAYWVAFAVTASAAVTAAAAFARRS